jgi:hypothetical protein
MTSDDEDIVAQLSEPVRAALSQGVTLVESLLAELSSKDHRTEVSSQ